MRALVALALALVAGAAGAETPAPDLAYGAYQRGEFGAALAEALKRVAADKKDAAAMTLIGEIFKDGAAVKQDYGEAAGWFKLASGLGDGGAAFELGALQIAGAPGVPADRASALAQFQRAADKGVAQAFTNLGIAATQKEGQTPDYAKAAGYFRKGAEAGDPEAAYSLGELLREGTGVDKDEAEAAKWLRAAADRHLVEAEIEFGIMAFNGVGVPADETLAASYLRAAAGRHNPIAQNRLAHLYVSGRGVPKDLVLATVWNELAKGAGLSDASLDQGIGALSAADDHKAAELIRAYAAF